MNNVFSRNAQRLTLNSDLIFEHTGDDCLVYQPDSSSVVKLSGESALIVAAVRSGQSLSSFSPVAVQELVDRQVLSTSQGISRRSVLRAGALGVGAGVATLAMPSVAAASSITDVALSDGLGIWFKSSTDPNFRLGGYDFPDLGSGTLLNGDEINKPSALSVALDDMTSVEVPVVEWDSTGDENVDELLWRKDGAEFTNVSGVPLTGVFTWGAVRYTVTFAWNPV